jgi:hypothetical protein
MINLTLKINKDSMSDIKDIMEYFRIDNYQDLFSKSLSALKILAYIGKTDGELIARKDSRETIIVLN